MITKIGEATLEQFANTAKKLKNLPPDIQSQIDEICNDLPAQREQVVKNNKATQEIFDNITKKFESAPKLDPKVTKFPTAAVGAAIGIPVGAALYLRHVYKKNRKKQ